MSERKRLFCGFLVGVEFATSAETPGVLLEEDEPRASGRRLVFEEAVLRIDRGEAVEEREEDSVSLSASEARTARGLRQVCKRKRITENGTGRVQI